MAKYVKTTDGHIFETERVKMMGNTLELWKTIDGKPTCETYRIEKVSDYIEDFLNETVVYHKYVKVDYIIDFLIDDKEIYEYNDDEHIVFGAMWINHNLISVAKLNKDNKWELI